MAVLIELVTSVCLAPCEREAYATAVPCVAD